MALGLNAAETALRAVFNRRSPTGDMESLARFSPCIDRGCPALGGIPLGRCSHG